MHITFWQTSEQLHENTHSRQFSFLFFLFYFNRNNNEMKLMNAKSSFMMEMEAYDIHRVLKWNSEDWKARKTTNLSTRYHSAFAENWTRDHSPNQAAKRLLSIKITCFHRRSHCLHSGSVLSFVIFQLMKTLLI